MNRTEDPELLAAFREESKKNIERMQYSLRHLELASAQDRNELMEELLAAAHNFKGDASLLGLKKILALAEQIHSTCKQVVEEEKQFSIEELTCLNEWITKSQKLVNALYGNT